MRGQQHHRLMDRNTKVRKTKKKKFPHKNVKNNYQETTQRLRVHLKLEPPIRISVHKL